jgi:IS5 family transposase
LIHTLTEGGGMPLANCTTAANGSEREQILLLLDSVKLKTLKKGRPRKRVKVLVADKGYDSQEKRAALRQRGIRPQLPKRIYKTKKNRGRPIKISVPRFRTARDVSPGIKENIVVLWFDGNVKKLISMPFCL